MAFKVKFWSWANILVGMKWMVVNFVTSLIVIIPIFLAFWIASLGSVAMLIGIFVYFGIMAFALNMSGYLARRWWGWK